MSVHSTMYLEEDTTTETELNEFAESICYTPENFAYFGDLDPDTWGRLDFAGQHRDSDVLARANHKVILEDLEELYPDAVTVESSSHWAVGWVEVIRLDTRNRNALRRALAWKMKLEDYPVADDDTYSEMEQEECLADWDSWAADWVKDLILDHQNPDIPAVFLDDGDDLNEEGMEYGFHAFHDAWMDSGGDPREERVIEGLEDEYRQMLEDQRREFERYQPPMFEVE